MQTKIEKILNIVKDICNLADNEEVHLHHILRAIETKATESYGIDTQGVVTDEAFIYTTRFDLTLPLHRQSDEFISWLYGVLVGE